MRLPLLQMVSGADLSRPLVLLRALVESPVESPCPRSPSRRSKGSEGHSPPPRETLLLPRQTRARVWGRQTQAQAGQVVLVARLGVAWG